MFDFTNKVIINKICNIDDWMQEEEIAVKKLATLIIFEIIHETALTIEREDIILDILRKTGPQPFEFMSKEDDIHFESLRTPTGNLQSGVSHFKNQSSDITNVRYFLDPTSIGLLANIYSKINHYYYDDEGVVFENLVPAKYRTPEMVLKAAKLILTALDYQEIPSDEDLIGMILNREGTKEKSLSVPINLEGEDLFQSATDPLKSQEIIQMINELKQSSGKKIFTVFGYSGLGYENIDLLKETFKDTLLKLSPKEYIINIGATEDGIGCVYEIARDLGFETIGIVSNLALSYSGKFSGFVQKIYIVNDEYWGGFVPGTNKLAETTKIYLAISDELVAFGGGYNTAVTFTQARALGIKNTYIPFEMNHEIAIKQSGGKEVDFKGQAYYTLFDK